MSAQSAAQWQEMLAGLAREWGSAEMELLNEAVADLHSKYSARKKSLLGRTAMIVDDSVTMRMMLEDWLGEAGINVTARAENGFDAVKLFNGADRFDYVFLNVAMPEMDGIEALSDFKNKKDSFIIIVTSTKLTELFLRSVQNGANQVLYRPFNFGTLLKSMCMEYRFTQENYDVVFGLLTGMGANKIQPSQELTQEEVFALAVQSSGRKTNA